MRSPRLPLACVALALAASPARAGQSMLAPRGPAARDIASLGSPVLWIFGVVAIVMWLLIAWVALRRRGSLGDHAPAEDAGGQGWILIGGFAIPFAILAGIFIATLATMNDFPMHDGPPRPAEIEIVGHQWWWEVHYVAGPLAGRVVTANEIHIPAGRPVEIALRSADVIHSFWVPQLHGKVDLVPGQVNHIRIEADRPGSYRGECGEYCGAQHAHMILHVVAEAPDRYAAWLAHQRTPAATPANAVAQAGQRVYLAQACVLCHTVRGTRSLATIGPDLTHVASRGTLATAFPNDRAYLTAWVTHAQSLKPGAQMPDLTQMTGEETQQLVAYLEQLR